MRNFNLCRPLSEATVTYAFRDSGGEFSEEIIMDRGINEPSRNIIFPVCDEIRITATLPEIGEFDRVHLAGLNILDGLSFDIAGGDSIDQAVYARPKSTHRQTLRFDPVNTLTPTLTISGINQRQLQMRQMMFAKVGFTPEYCFDYGSIAQISNRFTPSQTGGSNYFQIADTTHGRAANFSNQSDDAVLDAEYFLDEILDRGYCLLEENDQSDDHTDSYIARVSMSEVNPVAFNLNSFTLNYLEAFKQ